MKAVSKSAEIGGKTLTLETGQFAGQASAAVVARCGETMVLATVVLGEEREELNYVPLVVDYIERLYAGGKIKGSRWVKREGRPSDEATLTARLVDRSVRPLFPEGFRNEVQVIITVLSVDGANNPDILAICATSAALAISEIPWEGPVAGIRVGYVAKNEEGVFVANPTHQDLEYSEMDLIITTNAKALLMIEGGGNEIPEEKLVKALKFIQGEGEKVVQLIKSLQKEVGVKKKSFSPAKFDNQLIKEIEKEAQPNLADAVTASAAKTQAKDSLGAIEEALIEKHGEEKKKAIRQILDHLVKKIVRDQVIKKGKRIDGRKPDEIRELEAEVGLLPRTHGSAMFRRGNTQTLTVTTLGSPALEQLIESMEGEETKRYMHHYYMPPFSLGEVGRLGWPSRREVGHGALAERALLPMIPLEEKFPYTIRIVSEILSSNGSTSMAAVCGSTLSLMDAGVPIKNPVAGIAMGMITEGEKRVILSDILGTEDFNGDMDFKIAGTKKGITAIQMDVKQADITPKVIEAVLTQAREGRLFILESMLKVLPASRAQISKFAPKVEIIRVPVDKIGEIIGPGGKTIRRMIEETGAAIDIEDDGTVSISAPDKEGVEKAVSKIKGLTREVKVGETFEGTVKRIQPFGAFVEILPGKEGLVHVSKMSTEYVRSPSEVVKEGEKVKVRVVEIDERGRINLSMIFGERKPPSRPSRPHPRTGRTYPPRRPFRPRR